MESLAYLHVASAHEASNTVESVTTPSSLKFFAGLNWKKVSSCAAIRLLSVALSVAVLSIAGEALALQKVGSRGTEVTNIQRCLQNLGYFNGPITGYYGSLTRNSVSRFQQANRLAVDGIVGGNTQQALQSQCESRNPGNTTSSILRVGSRGTSVRNLQENLRLLGYFDARPTGNFDQVTRRAVLEFQQDNRLIADGIVGSRTGTAINTRIAQLENPGGIGGDDEYPFNLNLGDRGSEVTSLQQDLSRLGYFNASATGYFGPVTRDAVLAFQRAYRLNPTGIADATTLQAIRRALGNENSSDNSPGRNVLSVGSRGEDVRQLQQRLQQLGYFNSTPTGYFGPVTRAAVIAFQRASGLPVTGTANAQTWTALGLQPSSNRYVVVVPIRNADTLYEVRQYVPTAFTTESRLGDYVNAGQYNDRYTAESLSSQLRSYGLDARVEFL